jgi:hypothetical protein
MTATTRDTEGNLPEQPAQASDNPEATASATEPGTVPAPGANQAESSPPLLMSTPADRCTVCSAEMAPDQRYCVECGTRRGKARFTLAGSTTSVATSAAAPSTNPLTAGWTRLTALLAIVIVLLALGIGVLIGNSSASISQPVKVQITGGALSSGTSGGSHTTGTSKTSTTSGKGSSTKPGANLFSSGS